jgi:hypothetical protein
MFRRFSVAVLTFGPLESKLKGVATDGVLKLVSEMDKNAMEKRRGKRNQTTHLYPSFEKRKLINFKTDCFIK